MNYTDILHAFTDSGKLIVDLNSAFLKNKKETCKLLVNYINAL